jgi:hypothetical protein
VKAKIKACLVIALLFFAGFVAGVVVTRGMVRHFVREAATRPDRVRDLIERRLVRQLDLDDGQRVQVRQILDESQSELGALRTEFRPQFVAIFTNAEQRVASVLDEKQRARFDKLRAEYREFWEPESNR